MSKIKPYIIEFIWSGNSVTEFEQWLYVQDSDDFEKNLGEKIYVDLLSYNYKSKTAEEVKQFFKSILNDTLIQEFNKEFKLKNSNAIKGKCIKQTALDYGGVETRDWGVKIGKEYEFLIIQTGIQNGNHSSLVNYVDKENDFRPSGFIPMELFEINLDQVSNFYHKLTNELNETTIEIKAFSKIEYQPRQCSFWEDLYDDHEKAIVTYYDTLNKIGIKNAW